MQNTEKNKDAVTQQFVHIVKKITTTIDNKLLIISN